MRVDLLSLFPEMFESVLNCSILKRAQEKGMLQIGRTDIRTYANNKHHRVDDRPYGGGPGMVMQPGPVCEAIRKARSPKAHVVYLTPQGAPLTAKRCRELSEKEHLVLLAGHYEGIDQRAIEAEVDEEISIGDYVLTNGCLPAMVLLDAVLRFIPGVLGDEESAEQDSFEGGLLDCPHYTRPEVFEGNGVPEVLRNGDHGKIRAWRLEQSKTLTRRRRPDLLKKSENV